jgi:hypothetical protein
MQTVPFPHGAYVIAMFLEKQTDLLGFDKFCRETK